MFIDWCNFAIKYIVNENNALFKGMRLWKYVIETEMSMKAGVF